MSTLSVSVDSGLARLVARTRRLREQRRRWPGVAALCAAVDLGARAVFHVWRNRRYLSTAKLANMALVNLQYKLKTQRVIGRPYKLKIESTNICNTHCQLCPTGLGLAGRPKGRMTLEQFKGLIDKMRWHLVALDLSMWGDPLIVPEIGEMIRYAHDRGVWTYLSSNLHAFKPEKGQAEMLVRSGLDLLTCSLHGATQATYGTYQPGKQLDVTLEKIRQLVATRKRLGSRTPEIQLNFVVTRFNEHEQAAFARLAEELGCKAVFSWAALNVRLMGRDRNGASLGLAPDVLRAKIREHIEKWLPEDREHALAPYAQILDGTFEPGQFNGKKMYGCAWPWQASVINWDGNVSTCCGSWDVQEDLGNVFEQPFAKIWNGKKYQMARRSFSQPVTGEEAQDNPCAKCPGFML